MKTAKDTAILTMVLCSLGVTWASVAHLQRRQRAISLKYEIADLRKRMAHLQEESLELQRERASHLDMVHLKSVGNRLGLRPPSPTQFKKAPQ